MGETCCLCFPLNCGVTTLAVLNILGTLSMAGYCYTDATYCNLFWPLFAAGAVMSVIWLYALCAPSESSKKTAFLGFFVTQLIFSIGYYAFLIITGKATDYVCNADNLGHMNEDIEQIEDQTGEDLGGAVTLEDCKWGGKYGLITDCTIKFLLTAYFTHVIMRWSKHDDSYNKH